MPKLLHIKASPRRESFSARATETFLDSYRQTHHGSSVETLDLFAAEIPPFLAPQAAAKYEVLAGKQPSGPAAAAWKAVIETIEHFKSGEVVVISSPMWNFSIPYRLKQYLDVIVQPGLTFSYTPEAGYTGLVTGRPAVLVLARGGSYAPGSPGEAYDMQKPYLESILRFIGFTDIRTLIVEPTLAGDEEAALALVAAKTQAVALGKTL
jgi:FMN-dependent NADH-azoreductase